MNNFHWTDITGEFAEAVNDLSLGQVLHDEMFGLFEAMSAIEMMDPKMDVGMLCNRTSKKVNGFDDAVRAGTIKIVDLSLEEKIGIIDDSLGCLVTWLEGHSLAQTVFTNVYLQRPKEIADPCLRAFCLVLLSLVDLIREFIMKASVFEEEDFQQLTYGYQLSYDIADTKLCGMLREVEEDLQRRTKSLQRNSNGTNAGTDSGYATASKATTPDAEQRLVIQEDDQESSGSSNNELQLSIALAARLKFFRLFLSVLSGLRKEIFAKQPQQQSRDSGNRRWPDSDRRQLDDIERQLQLCRESFQVWNETLTMGIAVDQQPTEKDVGDGQRQSSSNPLSVINQSSDSEARPDYPTIMGFVPLLNQRLLPPTFPRYTKMKTRREAVEHTSALINRIGFVLGVYECTCFHEALTFFDSFSKSRAPGSCVLTRSLLQLLYLRQNNLIMGEVTVTDCLRDAVQQFIRPPSLQPNNKAAPFNNGQVKEFLDLFFTSAARPMLGLLQISGHNRARQREKFAQALEELSALQTEAEKVDMYLNRLAPQLDSPYGNMGFFSTWVIFHILRLMVHYLLSGFELELYATHEYPYIYWYLYEFLLGWLSSTLNRAINMQEAALIEHNSGTKANRRGRTKKKQQKQQKPHVREAQISRALQELCGGLYRTVSGFKREGRLRQPWSGMNSERIRYEHRFAPFNSALAPPVVSYEKYKEAERQSEARSVPELYLMASTCFQQAKALLEDIADPDDEINAYLKVAKSNLIVVKLLLTGQLTKNSNSKKYPEFDFSVHRNFPIIRIL